MSTTPGGEPPREEPTPDEPPREARPPGTQPPPGYPPPGYQQPPPGYPPPPPGYPPPPGGYQPPPGYGPRPPAEPSVWSVALSDGWKAFGRVAGVFIGAMVVWAIIAAAVLSLVSVIFGGWGDVVTPDGRSPFSIGFHVSSVVVTVAGAFVVAFIVATFVRNAIDVTYGRRPGFGDFFRFTNAGPVAILALLIAAIHIVAGLVGWIPGIGQLVSLAIEFFLMFAYFFLIHRRLAPVDSIRGSIDLVIRNVSTTLVFFLLEILIILAGFIACGVGFFVAAPVVLLATAYLYRRLLGEQPVLPA